MLTDRKYMEDQHSRVFTLMYQQPSGCRERGGKGGREREADGERVKERSREIKRGRERDREKEGMRER